MFLFVSVKCNTYTSLRRDLCLTLSTCAVQMAPTFHALILVLYVEMHQLDKMNSIIQVMKPTVHVDAAHARIVGDNRLNCIPALHHFGR